MADLTPSTSTNTAATTSAATTKKTTLAADDHRHSWRTVPPIVYLALGLCVAAFWLGGNLMQIQTTQAWMLGGAVNGHTLVPSLHTFSQIGDFLNGKLSLRMAIAFLASWSIQRLETVCEVGIERSQLFVHKRFSRPETVSESTAKVARDMAGFFRTASILLIGIDSISDFSYAAALGFWQQVLFTGVSFLTCFFFGIVAIHLITTGLSGLNQ